MTTSALLSRSPGRRPLLGPAALAASSLALVPLAYLFLRATDGGIEGILSVLSADRTAGLLWNTILLTAIVAAGSLVVGISLAWLTVRTHIRGARLIGGLACVPLALPSYVLGYLWVAEFPSFTGLPGAATVLVIACYPYVFLPVAAALRFADPEPEEVARTLGRGPVRTALTVVLRQISPAAAAGTLLVCLYTLSDYGAVALMRFEAFTVGIHRSYSASFDRVPAAILACVLVVLAVVVMVAERLARRGDTARIGSGVSRPPERLSLGRWSPLAYAFAGTVLGLGVAAPVYGLAKWLAAAARIDIDWARVATATASTAAVAGAAAVVTAVLALPIGILAARSDGPVARAAESLAQIGFGLPGITVGLAVVFVGIRLAPDLYQTPVMLVLAYAVLFLPLAVGVIRSAVRSVPTSLEDASAALGHGRARTFLRVLVPLTAPGVLAGASLVFLSAAKELPATLMLRPTTMDTLATRMWAHADVSAYSQAAPYAVMLVLIAAVPAIVLGRSFGWATPARPADHSCDGPTSGPSGLGASPTGPHGPDDGSPAVWGPSPDPSAAGVPRRRASMTPL